MKYYSIPKHLYRFVNMKSLLLTILFILTEVTISASSITVSGNVGGVWYADTVFVIGDMNIPTHETLSILPGTIIEFEGFFKMEVQGQIKAIGLPGDTILFAVRDTSNFGIQTTGRGGWSGIRIGSSASESDSSQFSYCSFKYGKATEDSSNCFGGAIQIISFSKVRISNCLFYNNYSYYSGGAIYLSDANIKIEHCIFKKNYSGNTGTIYGYGGGLCSMASSPVALENEFYANSSTGVGGGASFDSSNPNFSNNVFINNFSALGGALGILRSAPTRTLANNLVAMNEAKFFGGGICCIRSFPVFSNLTISGNQSSYGGGFYCNDSAVPTVYNSIIWGNTGLGNSVYIWDVRSAPNFYYCDIEGDTSDFQGSGGLQGYHGVYENNINDDPFFSIYGTNPFYLSENSPCIDSGIPDVIDLQLPSIDLIGVTRVVNGRIDMGAYEYKGAASIIENSLNGSLVVVSPNPFKTSTMLTFHQRLNYVNEFGIFNLYGICVRNLFLMPGENSVSWDGRNGYGFELPDGIYFLKNLTTNKMITAKLIKLFH
jgi:predicted outer membrane repeat protein